MAEYYVIRDKNTGLYFRAKGENRWGKNYNQVSVYRCRGAAEHATKTIAWNDEQPEVVPIQIIKPDDDIALKVDVAREIFAEIDKLVADHSKGYWCDWYLYEKVEELKRKYIQGKEV